MLSHTNSLKARIYCLFVYFSSRKPTLSPLRQGKITIPKKDIGPKIENERLKIQKETIELEGVNDLFRYST